MLFYEMYQPPFQKSLPYQGHLARDAEENASLRERLCI